MYGIGIAKGLMVTMKNFLRSPVTIQYPDRRVGVLRLARKAEMSLPVFFLKRPQEALRGMIGLVKEETRVPQHPRFRGEEFAWYEDRCTGCATCAKYCPLGIIRIVTHPSGDFLQEGESYAVDVFDIDIGLCMFCGLCVESCPYDALFMGSGFERARPTRGELVITVEELKRAEKRPSTWFRPQMDRRGYDPWKGEATWRDVGREASPWHPKRPGEMGDGEDLRSTSQGVSE